jgi:hypothetical protein
MFQAGQSGLRRGTVQDPPGGGGAAPAEQQQADCTWSLIMI